MKLIVNNLCTDVYISPLPPIEQMKKSKHINGFLKILTVILYSSIMIQGEHISGPLITFIFLGIFDNNLITTSISVLVILTLTTYIYSAIKPLKKILLIIGGIILYIPILGHIYTSYNKISFSNNKLFFTSLIIFVITYGIVTYKILKEKTQ